MFNLKLGLHRNNPKSRTLKWQFRGSTFHMKEKMKRLLSSIKDENGVETVEYAVLLGLIVVGAIGLIIWLGGWVQSQFQIGTNSIGS